MALYQITPTFSSLLKQQALIISLGLWKGLNWIGLAQGPSRSGRPDVGWDCSPLKVCWGRRVLTWLLVQGLRASPHGPPHRPFQTHDTATWLLQRQWPEREQPIRELQGVYKLISAVIDCHFCHIPLVTQTHPDIIWIQAGKNPRSHLEEDGDILKFLFFPCFIFYPHPRTFFSLLLEREEERKRNIHAREEHQLVASWVPPAQGLTHNVGRRPEWESNP